MIAAVNIARIVALFCAAALCMAGIRLLDALEAETQARAAVTRQVPDIIHAEAALIRGSVVREVSVTRREVLQRVDALSGMIDAHAGRIESMAVGEIQQTRADVLSALQPVASAAVDTLDVYRKLPSAVGERMDTWTDCRGNGACWQAQFTALLGASRVTAGETSRTMRGIREATPAIVANIDQTTANVARITKPDSLSVRLFKLAAPVAGGAIFGVLK